MLKAQRFSHQVINDDIKLVNELKVGGTYDAFKKAQHGQRCGTPNKSYSMSHHPLSTFSYISVFSLSSAPQIMQMYDRKWRWIFTKWKRVCLDRTYSYAFFASLALLRRMWREQLDQFLVFKAAADELPPRHLKKIIMISWVKYFCVRLHVYQILFRI